MTVLSNIIGDADNGIEYNPVTGEVTVRLSSTEIMKILATGTRLPNNVPLLARDNADSSDISIVKLNTSDLIEFGANISVIQLDNDTYLTALDNAGTGSISIVKVNTSDLIEFGATISGITLANNVYFLGVDNAGTGTINVFKINTSDLIEFGANIGVIQLDHDTYLTGLDNAGTGSVNIVKINTSDYLEIGTLLTADTSLDYESLVTADDDIPNKKYVDDLASVNFTMPPNLVQVDPDSDEVAGERYTTIANALVYIATQTPSLANIWGIKVSGTNAENVTLPSYVYIIGESPNQTILAGQIDCAGAFAGFFEYVIYNCTIADLVLGTGQGIELNTCSLMGGTPTDGTIYFANGTVVAGDFSSVMFNFLFSNLVIGGTFGPLSAHYTHFTPVASAVVLTTDSSFNICKIDNSGYGITYPTTGNVDFNLSAISGLPADIDTGLNLAYRECQIDITDTEIDGGVLVLSNCVIEASVASTITLTTGTLETFSNSMNGSWGLNIVGGNWNNHGDHYDNRTSGLSSLNFQDAIDELVAGGAYKISQGNSHVEVSDAGIGYVTVMVDGVESVRFIQEGPRLGNDRSLFSRNNADDGNIELIKANTSDLIVLGAKIGVINLANNTYLTGRNNADGANINIVKVTTSDRIEFGAQIAVATLTNNTFLTGRNAADGANIDIVKVNATNVLEFGAKIAVANLVNDTYLTGRNNADGGNVNIVKVNTTDHLEFGAIADIFKLDIDTNDVSNPPTDAELDAIYTSPAAVGAGWMKLLDDNNADANFYLIVSNGTSWWVFTGTKAV